MDVTHGTISASAEVTFGKNLSEADKPLHLKRLHGIVDFKEMGGFFKPTILQGLTTRVEILGQDETLRIPIHPSSHQKHSISRRAHEDITPLFNGNVSTNIGAIAFHH